MANNTISHDIDPYPLNRDFLASARLHLQHQIWVQSLGYLSHSSLPLKADSISAEVGSGTGIFSLELAKQLPTGSKIEAYDISLAQTPPKAWWPENVSFNELNIFDPIPQHLISRYDVVYVRHLVCLVQSNNPIPLLSALLKLLKPGGYLQWQEWDHQTQTVVTAGPDLSAPRMEAFIGSMRGPGNLQNQVSWLKDFHNRFSDAGAESVAYDRRRIAPEARLIQQEMTFLGAREWADNWRARNPANPEATEFENLANEAFGECSRLQRGSVVEMEMVTWVAKKK
jgi:SAM-dependent methyltransferase